jgi:hypothetical protein
MRVAVEYRGYAPSIVPFKPYFYFLMAANGKVDEVFDDTLIMSTHLDRPPVYIEMPDAIWGEGSGKAVVICDNCTRLYSERSAPGEVVTCPECGTPQLIPADAVLPDIYNEEL